MSTDRNKSETEKLWVALKKYGINNQQQLKEALSQMKPINIGCMTNKRKNQKQEIS